MKKGNALRTALAIALILALTLALSACGSKGGDSNEPSSADALYTLAFNDWGAGAEVFDWHREEVRYLVEDVLGMTLNTAIDENSPDGTLRNVQNFIASGVDGLLMTCNPTPLFPQLAADAMNAKMPFTVSIWIGTEDARAEAVETNEYFLGSFEADTYGEAYMLGQIAIADGNKTAIFIGGNIGDPSMDSRIEGFTKAFVEEGGGEILDIARCSGPPEAQEKASAVLSAYRDADCFYVMVGDYFPGSYNAMQALDISTDDMTVYASLCSTETSNYIKDGVIKAATGGHDIAVHLATAAMINYLDGHQILDANGKPPQFKVSPFLVTKENADDYMDVFFRMVDGQHVLPDDFFKSLLWRYNPDVSFKNFTDFLDAFSLEYFMSLHGK